MYEKPLCDINNTYSLLEDSYTFDLICQKKGSLS